MEAPPSDGFGIRKLKRVRGQTRDIVWRVEDIQTVDDARSILGTSVFPDVELINIMAMPEVSNGVSGREGDWGRNESGGMHFYWPAATTGKEGEKRGRETPEKTPTIPLILLNWHVARTSWLLLPAWKQKGRSTLF